MIICLHCVSLVHAVTIELLNYSKLNCTPRVLANGVTQLVTATNVGANYTRARNPKSKHRYHCSAAENRENLPNVSRLAASCQFF